MSFAENQRGEVLENQIAGSLTDGGGKPGQGYPAARIGTTVRKLTPTECERLMGWPDGWTIPTRALMAVDTPPAVTASWPPSLSGSAAESQKETA